MLVEPHGYRSEESDPPQVDVRDIVVRGGHHRRDRIRGDTVVLARRCGCGDRLAWGRHAVPGRKIPSAMISRPNIMLRQSTADHLIVTDLAAIGATPASESSIPDRFACRNWSRTIRLPAMINAARNSAFVRSRATRCGVGARGVSTRNGELFLRPGGQNFARVPEEGLNVCPYQTVDVFAIQVLGRTLLSQGAVQPAGELASVAAVVVILLRCLHPQLRERQP